MTKQAQSKTETATPAATPAAKIQKEKAPKVAKVSSATASTTSVVVTAPVVAAAAPAAAAAKVAKAPKAAKAVAPVVVPVVAEVVVAEASATVSSEFSDFMSKLQQLGSLISSLKTEFRSLEKKASRELKTATKASSKRKRKTGNRSPSGFVKPTLISDELASFLGKTKGTEMARTEVTREINSYIRANQLQDKANGRRINADTKLSSLLKLASGEELTYFNLQRYMSPHFAKSAAAVASA